MTLSTKSLPTAICKVAVDPQTQRTVEIGWAAAGLPASISIEKKRIERPNQKKEPEKKNQIKSKSGTASASAASAASADWIIDSFHLQVRCGWLEHIKRTWTFFSYQKYTPFDIFGDAGDAGDAVLKRHCLTDSTRFFFKI